MWNSPDVSGGSPLTPAQTKPVFISWGCYVGPSGNRVLPGAEGSALGFPVGCQTKGHREPRSIVWMQNVAFGGGQEALQGGPDLGVGKNASSRLTVWALLFFIFFFSHRSLSGLIIIDIKLFLLRRISYKFYVYFWLLGVFSPTSVWNAFGDSDAPVRFKCECHHFSRC